MKRSVLFACATLLLLWLLIPTTDVVAPEWSVIVTDAAGTPLEKAEVTVFSQQYTIESRDTEVNGSTGADGRIHFNGRKIRAIGLVRLAGFLSGLSQGAHASFGVHTWITASKAGYGEPDTLALFSQNERASRWNGKLAQSSHLVLMHCTAGYSGIGCTFPDDPGKPVLPLKWKLD